jgi:hypothetical protein
MQQSITANRFYSDGSCAYQMSGTLFSAGVLTKGFDLFISFRALIKEAPDKLKRGRSELDSEMTMLSSVKSKIIDVVQIVPVRHSRETLPTPGKHTFMTDAFLV